MKYSTLSLGLIISGLTTMSVLEAWRPGFVSGAINISWLWLGSVAVIMWLISRRPSESD